ncbi:MAG: IclR family transcriptional regulator [Acidimicrobiales bacterium]|nr:IclR family transcriptional regulator [Acidimicrobiales bacterium]
MGTTVSGVGVLDKSVAVLDVLENGPASLAALVAATGLSRATAHRLAVALEAHGLVRRDADGRFALGVRLIALGQAAARAIPLAEAARPALEALRKATGESVQLYVREGSRRVCIASLESPHGLRTIVPLGASLPLERGSAGRALTLSGRSPDAGARVSTDATFRHPWVESVEEREAGVASVSAPVFGPDGAVVAAVSVSGPIDRTTRRPGRKYADKVVEAARRIERAAGYRS